MTPTIYNTDEAKISKLIDLHGMTRFMVMLIRVCESYARTYTKGKEQHERWINWARGLELALGMQEVEK